MKPFIFNKSGFSLIELVLVLSLVAIMSFVAIPAIVNVQDVTLDGASRKLESDLRYAQNLSVTTGEAHGFKTTGGENGSTYEIYKVSDGQPVSSPYDHKPMQEDFTSGNDKFTGITFQGSDTITFDGVGTPTYVLGDGNITLQNSDGSTKDVAVSNTGLINIQ